MKSILGVDAAWTHDHPSGVCLLKEEHGEYSCVALAPSYEDFYCLADGIDVNWDKVPYGSIPDVERLLLTSSKLLNNNNVSVITVDMPISISPITGRREAENAISKAFGAMGCGAHSPSILRPGKISTLFLKDCLKNNFEFANASTTAGQVNTVIEVYPHPALIDLLGLDYRLTYKAGNTSTYWPQLSVKERKAKLLGIYQTILTALSKHITGIPLSIPEDLVERPFSYFKRYEDVLDALVCGWIGMKYLGSEAKAYGDKSSAMWVTQ